MGFRRDRIAEIREPRHWSFLMDKVVMWSGWSQARRGRMLRRLGLDVGEGALVQACHVSTSRVRIGAWSYIGPGCRLDARASIWIGDRVALADEVMLVTSSHHHGDSRVRAGKARNAPIRVEDGAWLGARVVVLPGVVVGEGVVVAAGAIVTSNCAPHGLYAGVPARRIRDLPVTPEGR